MKNETIPYEVLVSRQNYPLDIKVEMTQNRIREWYKRYSGDVYVAFSGGRDSTVLLHMVRKLFPDVPAVFCDTGLEYPEIKEFVKTFENVVTLRPRMTFKEVLERYGYPVISKQVATLVHRLRSPGTSEAHRRKTLYGDERGTYGKLPDKWHFLQQAPFNISDHCCHIMKMEPVEKYHKETGRVGIVGTMACDSKRRQEIYQQHGCFVTDTGLPRCTPMAFWRQNDVIEYIETYNIPYCKIYDTGLNHTGCIYCCFGIHKEPRPGDVRQHWADISMARNIIGFEPNIKFEEGIKNTVDWYNKIYNKS